MKDFLRFLQSLSNPKEIYIEADLKSVDNGILIFTYDEKSDEQLQEEARLLEETIGDKECLVKIMNSSAQNKFDVYIGVRDPDDGFNLFNISIFDFVINEIKEYLEKSSCVKISFNNKNSNLLNLDFTLFLEAT